MSIKTLLLLTMRKKRKIVLTLTIILFVILWKWREKVDDQFMDKQSCPACYGLNQCRRIFNTTESNLELIFYSRWKIINKLLNVKNVFYGQTKSSRIYVLKKLAHDVELHKFDETICHMAGYYIQCRRAQAITNAIFYRKNFNLISIIERYPKLFENNDVIRCKQRNVINLLFEKYEQINDDENNYFNFLTLMAINPEPLVMQAFHDVVPMPMYLGACGRVAVEEYVGEPLSKFYDSPFLQRAKLAIQLLKMAVKMSENDIRLYMTDPSSDNFAVDDHGVLRIIDTENIILLDSKDQNLDPSEHHNDGVGCHECFSFVYEDLCSHRWSDHNYFAICKGLLSSNPFSTSLPGGLLHSIPVPHQEILSQAIEECASPKKVDNRKFPAKELLHLLLKTVQSNRINEKPELK